LNPPPSSTHATALTKALKEAEGEISNLPHERSYFFDAAGTQIYHPVDGTATIINYTKDDVEAVRGSIGTHGHPDRSGPSPDDLVFGAAADLVEMRVATRDARYIAQRPASGWVDEQKIWDSYTVYSKLVDIELDKLVRRGLFSKREAARMSGHLVARRICEELGIPYQRYTMPTP
jgi:hypothetical protein